MEFFIDTANIDEIKEAYKCGWVDGVTTNPSLIAKQFEKYKSQKSSSNVDIQEFKDQLINGITDTVKGPVSIEVTQIKTAEDMITEGTSIMNKYKKDNIVIKIPMTIEGLKATRALSQKNIGTNMTLIFHPLQALMCAKAGATFVSPFVGRLDDISTKGMDIVSQIHTLFMNYQFKTKILVASTRHPLHILEAGLLAADVVTMPFKVMKQLVEHPLTDIGIDRFAKDHERMHTTF